MSMDGQAFYVRVNEHPELVWLGVIEGDETLGDAVVVAHTPRNVKFATSTKSILETDWEQLEGVLTGKREPDIMRRLSRIVGYFSTTRNWNHSKLAELRDRQKGSYTLPEKKRKKIIPSIVDQRLEAGAEREIRTPTLA